MRTLEIDLPAGQLILSVREERDWPLERLLDFAARENPKRSFLFVSKVLGKHLPAKPAEMRAAHKALGQKILDVMVQDHTVPKPSVLVLSLAETATGLGYGLFQALKGLLPEQEFLFWNSSRYRELQDVWLSFEESHSHAPNQWMCGLSDQYANDLASVQTLILADDEISTGNTFANLLKAMGEHLPALKQVIVASLADFSNLDSQMWHQKMGIKTEAVALISGHYQFLRNPQALLPSLPKAQASGARPQGTLLRHWGRYGLREPQAIPSKVQAQVLELLSNLGDQSTGFGPVLVLGCGEFMQSSLDLAEWIQEQGFECRVQSTTRSPILPGLAIQHKWVLPDPVGEATPHYLYNVNAAEYRALFICVEPGMSVEFVHALQSHGLVVLEWPL